MHPEHPRSLQLPPQNACWMGENWLNKKETFLCGRHEMPARQCGCKQERRWGKKWWCKHQHTSQWSHDYHVCDGKYLAWCVQTADEKYSTNNTGFAVCSNLYQNGVFSNSYLGPATLQNFTHALLLLQHVQGLYVFTTSARKIEPLSLKLATCIHPWGLATNLL